MEGWLARHEGAHRRRRGDGRCRDGRRHRGRRRATWRGRGGGTCGRVEARRRVHGERVGGRGADHLARIERAVSGSTVGTGARWWRGSGSCCRVPDGSWPADGERRRRRSGGGSRRRRSTERRRRPRCELSGTRWRRSSWFAPCTGDWWRCGEGRRGRRGRRRAGRYARHRGAAHSQSMREGTRKHRWLAHDSSTAELVLSYTQTIATHSRTHARTPVWEAQYSREISRYRSEQQQRGGEGGNRNEESRRRTENSLCSR